MKIKLQSALGAALGLALASLVAGCATGLSPIAQTRTRIQEKNEAYNKLTPQQQNYILGGVIERGDTPDMVYMALGKPQKIVSSSNGRTTMWVYVEYYAANSAATTSANNPNARYSPGMTMVNDGGNQMVGDNVNLSGGPAIGSAGAFASPKSLTSTTATGPMQSLALPDLASNTVYVFFYQGKVAEIKLDGDDSTQISSHQPAHGKNGLNSSVERKV